MKNKRKKLLFRIVVSVAGAFSFSQTTFSNERVTFTYFLQSRYQKNRKPYLLCVLGRFFRYYFKIQIYIDCSLALKKVALPSVCKKKRPLSSKKIVWSYCEEIQRKRICIFYILHVWTFCEVAKALPCIIIISLGRIHKRYDFSHRWSFFSRLMGK